MDVLYHNTSRIVQPLYPSFSHATCQRRWDRPTEEIGTRIPRGMTTWRLSPHKFSGPPIISPFLRTIKNLGCTRRCTPVMIYVTASNSHCQIVATGEYSEYIAFIRFLVIPQVLRRKRLWLACTVRGFERDRDGSMSTCVLSNE